MLRAGFDRFHDSEAIILSAMVKGPRHAPLGSDAGDQRLGSAPAPAQSLVGLTSGTSPRRAREDPLPSDHLVSREILDPDPIGDRQRRAFELIRVRASGSYFISRSRRSIELVLVGAQRISRVDCDCDVLEQRHTDPNWREEPFETSDFRCRGLAEDLFLLSYLLRQGQRVLPPGHYQPDSYFGPVRGMLNLHLC